MKTNSSKIFHQIYENLNQNRYKNDTQESQN